MKFAESLKIQINCLKNKAIVEFRISELERFDYSVLLVLPNLKINLNSNSYNVA